MKLRQLLPAATLAFAFSGATHAQEELTLDQLLERVASGSAEDQSAEQERLRQFEANQAEQQNLLAQGRQQQANEEARSEQLETNFEENELLIADRTAQLDARLGSLRELFGVLQQVAGDARAQFENSPTNIEYPDRAQFLTDLAAKMGETTVLPSIDEIERLWFLLQQEATETRSTLELKGREQDEQIRTLRADADERRMQRLLALFGSAGEDDWTFGVDDGMLDGRRLARVVANPADREVFRRPRPVRTGAAVVGFLIDNSGSMKRQRFRSVATLVDTFSRALDLAGIANEVLGFTTGAWSGGRALADWQRQAGATARAGASSATRWSTSARSRWRASADRSRPWAAAPAPRIWPRCRSR